jgi:hypothetical protein
MIGLQKLALQYTEPDFFLREPAGVLGQPVDLEAQPPLLLDGLFAQPALQLFGRVGRAIIRYQRNRVDPTTLRRRYQDLVYKTLELDKAFAALRLSTDLTIGKTQRCDQVARATMGVARRLPRHLPAVRGAAASPEAQAFQMAA